MDDTIFGDGTENDMGYTGILGYKAHYCLYIILHKE
jgi:hypothetical protein